MSSAAKVVLTVLFIAAPVCGFAQESPGMEEMRMAERHAAQAARSQDLREVKSQLEQALNCLVGRGSGEYRTAAGDPCKGASALQKLPGDSVNRIRVEKAIRLASVGVTFHDFKPAHYTAQAVQAVLEEGVGPGAR
jgi:hypothetical protein